MVKVMDNNDMTMTLLNLYMSYEYNSNRLNFNIAISIGPYFIAFFIIDHNIAGCVEGSTVDVSIGKVLVLELLPQLTGL